MDDTHDNDISLQQFCYRNVPIPADTHLNREYVRLYPGRHPALNPTLQTANEIPAGLNYGIYKSLNVLVLSAM